MKGILKGIGFFFLYFILMMIFQSLSSIGFMGIAAAKGCRDEQQIVDFANKNLLGVTVISGILIVLVFFLIFRIRKSDVKKEWKLRKTDRTYFLLSISVSFSYSLLFYLLTYNASIENSLMIHDSVGYYSGIFPGLGIIMMIINLIVIAPVSEEIALRGIVYTRIEKTANPITAIIVSSVFFGLIHLMAGGIILVAGSFIMGAVFGIVFYKTNSLLACFIAHAAANLPDFIFYGNPELPGGLMILLEILSCAVFIFGIIFLIRKKTANS
ncbi:MAG: CPBP family intramembrane metalloprotease [Oscillospiraceae bacterium]|nr:CPBP family intramembrane metalloprotease [Oscillospiraceae bacterium]